MKLKIAFHFSHNMVSLSMIYWTGFKIKLLRDHLSVTRTDLAEYLKLPPRLLRHIEECNLVVDREPSILLNRLAGFRKWTSQDIKIYKKKCGLSFSRLARELNVKRSEVKGLCNSKRKYLPIKVLERLQYFVIPNAIDWSTIPWSGRGLRRILSRIKWKPAYLAKRLKVTSHTVSNWLRGATPSNKNKVLDLLLKKVKDVEWIIKQMNLPELNRRIILKDSSVVYIKKLTGGKVKSPVRKK